MISVLSVVNNRLFSVADILQGIPNYSSSCNSSKFLVGLLNKAISCAFGHNGYLTVQSKNF